MTVQLSRERLEGIKRKLSFMSPSDLEDAFPSEIAAWEVMAFVDIALAGIDSNPVAVRCRWKDEGDGAGSWLYFNMNRYDALASDPTRDCELLYTAPPAPVAVHIPPEKPHTDGLLADGWNACLAAMLKAGPVTEATVPLDYVQGEYDGREWAAQLAEANHPQTGDWLYDDPIELAKAIRKGPDMPIPAAPEQEV